MSSDERRPSASLKFRLRQSGGRRRWFVAGMAVLAAAQLVPGSLAGGATLAAPTPAPLSVTPQPGTYGRGSGGEGVRLSVMRRDHLMAAPRHLSRARLAALEASARPLSAALRPASGPRPGAGPSYKGHQLSMVQIDFESPSGSPWSLSTFQYLASKHINGVEINLHWNLLEPKKGQFSLGVLKSYLKDAAQLHIVLVPIFWESVWAGNPPSWLNAPPELTNTGAVGPQPAMWSSKAYRAYSTYVTTVLRHITNEAGYGGAYIDYGWLDAIWGPPEGPGGRQMFGYAPVDVAAFHQWLARQYQSVQALNRSLGTDYSSFMSVPAFQPGAPHFSVYEKFRMSSYPDIMSHLLSQVRRVTSKPLFLYFGGGLVDAGVLGNIPDQIFTLAKRFDAAVTLDDADNTALADMMGYLSQYYRVPLLFEWTPIPGNAAELAFWQGHYTLEGVYRLGEDYFIYSGGPAKGTFAAYLADRALEAQVRGRLPAYRTAILVGYDQVTQGLPEEGENPARQCCYGIPGGDFAIANYLDTARPAAQVITDMAVLDGRVHLSRFSTIIDWSNDMGTPGISAVLGRKLAAFKAHGGKIISAPLVGGMPAPAALVPAAFSVTPPSTQIEAWVVFTRRRAWITVANGEEDLAGAHGATVTVGNVSPYSGTLRVNPVAGVSSKVMTIHLSLPAGSLREYQVARSVATGPAQS